MSKVTKAGPEATQTLLFALGNSDGRDRIRGFAKENPRSFTIQFDRIKIRPGFNRRRQKNMSEEQYEEYLEIPELAKGIYQSNGSAEPLIGDIVDGVFWITEGERRYRAIRHLLNEYIEYPNGELIHNVDVLLNPKGTTDLERALKIFTTNSKKKLSPMETAYGFLWLKDEFKLSNAKIAEIRQVSRQMVDNYIIAATELPEKIQEAIDNDEIKITNAINEYRLKNRAQKNSIDEDAPFGDANSTTAKQDLDEFVERRPDNTVWKDPDTREMDETDDTEPYVIPRNQIPTLPTDTPYQRVLKMVVSLAIEEKDDNYILRELSENFIITSKN